jgi:hypothetical protein
VDEVVIDERKEVLLSWRAVEVTTVDGRWPCLLCLDLVSRSVVFSDSLLHFLMCRPSCSRIADRQ